MISSAKTWPLVEVIAVSCIPVCNPMQAYLYYNIQLIASYDGVELLTEAILFQS